MTISRWLTLCGKVAAALLLSAACTSAAEMISLKSVAIATDADQPSYVQYAVQELADYLQDIQGARPRVAVGVPTLKETAVCIAIGPQAAQALGVSVSAEKLGPEGFLLKAVQKDGGHFLIAAGATPRGSKAAVSALLKAITFADRTAAVPAGLDVLSKPRFASRGMHFNGWTFNYPHTFRSWREQDWRQFLDILSYQGVSLFYLWPFMEIMPLPLSTEDQAYLEECRRVIDYAQKRHGMEVWIMQCTNRVANDRCGAADPRFRPYWRPEVQQDLNPGKPADYQAIMDSRAAMYRILNNADGVCNIDSDPGFCPGSPLRDYVKVLQGCRALLDRYNLHGKQAKLVHWMLWGWGRAGISTDGLFPHQMQTLQALKQGLHEPFWVISGQFPEFLTMCRDEDLLSRTVFLPYCVIEGEPAYPSTKLNFGEIRTTFSDRIKDFPGLWGVMGNVQTPLLQLPHIYCFTSCAWDPAYRERSDREMLLDLCGHLYPAQRPLLADCYQALLAADPAAIEPLAAKLADVAAQGQLGPPGLIGRKLFPDDKFIAQMLVQQLRLRAAEQRLFRDISAATPAAACEKLLNRYIAAYLDWDLAHGWHGLWGWQKWPLGNLPNRAEYPAFCAHAYQSLGGKPGVQAAFARIAAELAARYDADAVRQGCVAHLKNAILAHGPKP